MGPIDDRYFSVRTCRVLNGKYFYIANHKILTITKITNIYIFDFKIFKILRFFYFTNDLVIFNDQKEMENIFTPKLLI